MVLLTHFQGTMVSQINPIQYQRLLQCITNAIQGSALTTPGHLRRLTFGFGKVRKFPWSPGQALWLIVFLADKAAKYFNMLVVTVYKTSQKMFFLHMKQLVQRAFHTISHVT